MDGVARLRLVFVPGRSLAVPRGAVKMIFG